MRRHLLTIATSGAALAVLAGGLVAAPAQAAGCQNSSYQPAACPTATAVGAPASVLVRYAEGSAGVELTATWNDPAGAARDSGFRFEISGPGGVSATAYPTQLPVVSGASKRVSAIYRAYNFRRPGVYTVKAVAASYGGTEVVAPATKTFVVKHESVLRMYASRSFVRPGQKIYFYGTLYPDNGVRAGQPLALSFQAKGTKKFKAVMKAKVKADGSYRFAKVKMAKQGKWRVTFKGSKYVLGSKATMTYKIR